MTISNVDNPWTGRIGWCHECCTVQMGDEARPRELRLGTEPATLEWVCVNCDGEPWGIGVWEDRAGYPDDEWTAAATNWAKTHEVPN